VSWSRSSRRTVRVRRRCWRIAAGLVEPSDGTLDICGIQRARCRRAPDLVRPRHPVFYQDLSLNEHLDIHRPDAWRPGVGNPRIRLASSSSGWRSGGTSCPFQFSRGCARRRRSRWDSSARSHCLRRRAVRRPGPAKSKRAGPELLRSRFSLRGRGDRLGRTAPRSPTSATVASPADGELVYDGPADRFCDRRSSTAGRMRALPA